jgi:predicted Zn-dependent protease
MKISEYKLFGRRVRGIVAMTAIMWLGAAPGAENQSAQYYYDQAINLEKSGDTIRAADMARESLRKNGQHVPALILLSRLSAESMQLRLGQSLIAKAIQLDSGNVAANILCAQIEYQLKNTTGLETCLGRVEKKDKNNPDVQSLRAQLLIDNGQYAIARRKIQGILRDHPGHTDTHLRLAGLYLKLKQFEKAESHFRKIQAMLPDKSDLAVSIARARLNAYFQSGNYTDPAGENDAAMRALDALRHAYANNPDSLSVSLMLAQLLSVTGKCGEALEYLRKLNVDKAESRSVVIFYAMCDSSSPEAMALLSAYLRRNEDDELTRHQSELVTLTQNHKREHTQATAIARYHRSLARRESSRNAEEFALSELRWSEFLFPGYIEAHSDLLRHFRVTKDYERMEDELVFLRATTQDRKYRDLVEQFTLEKRDLWYVKQGVQKPEGAKNLVPVHIFPLRPRDPMADHPLGGVAIADRVRVALQNYGRVRSISREMAALPQAQRYSPENLRQLRKTYDEALRAEPSSMPFLRKSMGYVLAGEFSEITHGVEVSVDLIDAESGIRVAELRFKSRGRSYLNKAAVRIAEFVYAQVPVSGNILRVLDSDEILVNLGRRDGVNKNSVFRTTDKLGKEISFKVAHKDFDIIHGKSDLSDATEHLKAGDVVTLVPPAEK